MVILSLGTSYYKTLTKRSVTAEGIEYDVSLPEPTEKQVEIAKNIDGVKYAGVQVKCAVIDEYKGKETRIRQMMCLGKNSVFLHMNRLKESTQRKKTK